MNFYNISNKFLNAHWTRFFMFCGLIIIFLYSEKLLLIFGTAILLLFCISIVKVLWEDWKIFKKDS